MKEVKEVYVTGYSYGKLIKGDYSLKHGFYSRAGTGEFFVRFPELDGRDAKIEVRSQYGWEDGCLDRDRKILVNPKYIRGHSGSPSMLANHKIMCDVCHKDKGGFYENEDN